MFPGSRRSLNPLVKSLVPLDEALDLPPVGATWLNVPTQQLDEFSSHRPHKEKMSVLPA